MRTEDIQNIPTCNRTDAAQLADLIIDEVVRTLQRDPGIATRSSRQWELGLAFARGRVVDLIHRRLAGHAPLDRVIDLISREYD